MTLMTNFEAEIWGETHRWAVVQGGTYPADPSNTQSHIAMIDETGECWATISVCIPGVRLEPGEFLMKTWSENEPAVRHLLDNGFRDTDKRVRSGFVQAEIWTFVKEDD